MGEQGELIATMAVIASGAILGRLQVRGVRLDVTAVMLVGVLAAHLGVTLSPALGLFGLLLFLYAIGVQAGPSLRGLGRKELRTALIPLAAVPLLAAATVGVALLVGLPLATALGAFAGLFSSGAALAIIEHRGSPGEAAAGFAIAAPLCSLLVMLIAQAWHARIGPRVQPEIDAWNAEMRRGAVRPISARIVVFREEAVGKTLRELRLACPVLAVHRGEAVLLARGDTRLEPGDIVRVSGTGAELRKTARALGRLSPGRGRRSEIEPLVRKYFVSNPRVIGERLETLLLRERYDATITRVRRAGIDLIPRPGFRFRWGDRVQVSTSPTSDDRLRALFGDDAHGLERFAFPRAALVIFLGGVLGALPLGLADGREVRLGPAVGVLALSLLTSALHRTGPLIWSQPARTLALLTQIGLPLFLAQVGNASYAGLTAAWQGHGPRLVAPVLVSVALGCAGAWIAGRALGYGPLATLSTLPALTLNTPAYTLVQDRHRERIPSAIYAAVYPITSLVMLSLFVLLSIALPN